MARFRHAFALLLAWALAACCIAGCDGDPSDTRRNASGTVPSEEAADLDRASIVDEIPPYVGEPTAELNGNDPCFTEADLASESFEVYSELDSQGRCGTAFALIGPETMPDEKRGSIGDVKPSGWKLSKYDWVDGKYLFNRCHLIAFSLAGENANPLNLITGTRSMNVRGMLPYEERVASYIESTANHVLYRVTPVFDGDNLVASGVLMEAESVEDAGRAISFCVWCYNVEPGVVIDYATGDNWAGDPESDRQPITSGAPQGSDAEAIADASPQEGTESSMTETASESSGTTAEDAEVRTYVLNTNTHRFHYPDCPSVLQMKDKNKQVFEGTREEVLNAGYQPCGNCKP